MDLPKVAKLDLDLQTDSLKVYYDFSLWLQQEFTSRCKRNPNYSLRAFAKLIEIDPSTVSQYLSKKRRPSSKMKLKIAKKLGAPKAQLHLFEAGDNKDESKHQFQLIELDKFHFISDWYHIAILELSCTEDFNPNPRSISRRLGITVEESKSAVERLKRLGLMREKNNSLIKTEKNMSNFSPGQTSKAHKTYQKQLINKGLQAVDECPQHLKDITSISMAIDISKLPEARRRIQNFRQKMCTFMEDGPQNEVYNMSIQLVPISKR